ncbi:methyl-accepting chemotaxis protein [Brevibacillus fluminis]|uniref:methyl-accepting chemotaxis protein n=1 Tax=Brevibacillus fluminis TaxID=511487 RepID=UPI003F892A3C
MLFRNMKISSKILLLVILAVIFLAAVGLAGLSNMRTMSDNSRTMYENGLLPIQMVEEMRINNTVAEQYVMELLMEKEQSSQQAIVNKIEEKLKINELISASYERSGLLPEEKRSLDELNGMLRGYKTEQDKVIKLALDGKNEEAYRYFVDKVRDMRQQVDRFLGGIASQNVKKAENLNKQNELGYRSSIMELLAIACVAIVLFMAVGYLISRMITKPLKQIQFLMEKAETGDLTVVGTYRSKDEIGVLTSDFNDMIRGLKDMMAKVNSDALHLASSAQQLSASTQQTMAATNQITAAIQEVSSGAERQLVSTEEMAKSMEEMAIGISRIAESSSTVSETSTDAAAAAGQGNQTVQEVVAQMGLIRSAVEQSATTVQRLGERSSQIVQIVDVITAIAAQTNLLALNAAIEAARAGEHGRGFAVVADEVRKLAEQSEQSGQQITSLIKEIQLDTQEAVKAMEKVSQNVETGMVMVGDAGQAFGSILDAISHVADQIQEVSTLSEEMSAISEEVAASVGEVERISRETAASSQMVSASSREQLASMEEIASSTQSLSQLSHELQEITSEFKLA